MYRPGQIVTKGAFDPDRLPNGCIFQNERVTRKRKSDRPDDIPPEFWHKATPQPRARWIAEATAKAAAEAEGQLIRYAELKNALETMPMPVTAPAMPVLNVGPGPRPHRPKISHPYAYKGLSMVARPVNKREVQTSAKAQAALRVEWDALRALITWDETKIREWSDVSR